MGQFHGESGVPEEFCTCGKARLVACSKYRILPNEKNNALLKIVNLVTE